eukprot:4190310-Prymnesium_polylepis.1
MPTPPRRGVTGTDAPPVAGWSGSGPPMLSSPSSSSRPWAHSRRVCGGACGDGVCGGACGGCVARCVAGSVAGSVTGRVSRCVWRGAGAASEASTLVHALVADVTQRLSAAWRRGGAAARCACARARLQHGAEASNEARERVRSRRVQPVHAVRRGWARQRGARRAPRRCGGRHGDADGRGRRNLPRGGEVGRRARRRRRRLLLLPRGRLRRVTGDGRVEFETARVGCLARAALAGVDGASAARRGDSEGGRRRRGASILDELGGRDGGGAQLLGGGGVDGAAA